MFYIESTDENIFLDFKVSIGTDLKKYDDYGLTNNNCKDMKRVECGDIYSIKNISQRTSPVYEGFDGWIRSKNSRNIFSHDLPFMRDSFMLIIYSFPKFKCMYNSALSISNGNDISNIKFEISTFLEVENKDNYHRIGLINTDGSYVNIDDKSYYVKGLSFFYLKPNVKISISNGNRFSMIGYIVENFIKFVSPVIETKKRKYRDLNSRSFIELNERLN